MEAYKYNGKEFDNVCQRTDSIMVLEDLGYRDIICNLKCYEEAKNIIFEFLSIGNRNFDIFLFLRVAMPRI